MGITEKEAKEDLELAGKILEAIMTYLRNNEFIS
jgi:hypothetical protein